MLVVGSGGLMWSRRKEVRVVWVLGRVVVVLDWSGVAAGEGCCEVGWGVLDVEVFLT